MGMFRRNLLLAGCLTFAMASSCGPYKTAVDVATDSLNTSHPAVSGMLGISAMGLYFTRRRDE